jgi:pSer/pThr/pTyr-binding forkhead associated (FHA) protein
VKLIIEDGEGRRTVLPLVRDEVLIGRAEGNTLRLMEKNVSRRHARILRDGDRFAIEDLGSFTGTRVNGEKIGRRRVISEGDLIEIGEYDLSIDSGPTDKTTDKTLTPGASADSATRSWIGPIVILVIVLAAAAFTLVWIRWHRSSPGAALPFVRYAACTAIR